MTIMQSSAEFIFIKVHLGAIQGQSFYPSMFLYINHRIRSSTKRLLEKTFTVAFNFQVKGVQDALLISTLFVVFQYLLDIQVSDDLFLSNLLAVFSISCDQGFSPWPLYVTLLQTSFSSRRYRWNSVVSSPGEAGNFVDLCLSGSLLWDGGYLPS